MEVDEYLTKFKAFLFSLNYSEFTITGYLGVARMYIRFSEGRGIWDKDTIRGFMGAQRAKGNSGNTLRHKFYTLKTFYECFEQPFPLTKRDVPKKSSKTKVMLVDEERKAMSATALTQSSPRDSAIIHVEEALGIRRIEFTFMMVQDYQRPYLFVRTGKGGIPVKRMLTNKACDVLDVWVNIRIMEHGALPKDALFNAGRGANALCLRQLSRIFKKAKENSGISTEKAGFHSFRRGIVTETLIAKVRYSEVTAEFGWKDPRTVLEYDIADKEQAERSMIEKSPMFAEQGHESSTEESPVIPAAPAPVPESALPGIMNRREARANLSPEQRRLQLVWGEAE